ncbi:MAG: preprotein translocase subunit SecE [Bdellovibrionaceae bacterium]|nr:preprotein translocase subunit SecE [Pseudobdellovibrionaceae bacterium]
MEAENKKIILAAYLVAAALTHFVVLVVFQSLAVSFGPIGRLWANEALQHIVPLGSAAAMFLFLMFQPKVGPFSNEVVTETKKVVWPSQKDTYSMTIVCCVMLVISGLVLGAFDFVSSNLVKMFINL